MTGSYPSGRPRPDCGTYAGYMAHLALGEPTCDPCRKANTAYHREYRQNNPDRRKREAVDSGRRDQARRILASEYPGRYREILEALRSVPGDTPAERRAVLAAATATRRTRP